MSDQELALPPDTKKKEDPLTHSLNKIVIYCVKALAILMIVVILASLVDVVYILYNNLVAMNGVPLGLLHVEGILTILGAFIAVLIAIEVFNNIIVYLKEDSLHAKLVLSTALIAISRKVIILDYKATPPEYVYALAAMVLATAIAYWVVNHKSPGEH